MASGAGNFREAAQARRSIYQLAAKSPIPDSRLLEIVREALLYCPSTFNTQTTRTVVVFGEEHVKLWNIIINIVQPSMAADVWNGYRKAHFEGFRSAYGTVSHTYPGFSSLVRRRRLRRLEDPTSCSGPKVSAYGLWLTHHFSML